MIITVAILVNIIAIGTQVEKDCHQLRKQLTIATSRVTLIVAFPPILNSIRTISSHISSYFLSNSPFPPIPDGKMEQIMSPW